jgi:transglutaminase-like putative cysteine protease
VRKTLLVIIFTAAIWSLGVSAVHAAVIEQKIDRQLKLHENYVQVTENVITSITDSRYFVPAGSSLSIRAFNPVVNDVKAADKIKKTLPTISVNDGNGNSIPFTTQISGQDIVIKTSYPANVSSDAPQQIVISYRSFALSSKTGAVYDVYIPSFGEGVKFSDERSSLDITTTVSVPQEFGELNLVNPQKPITLKNHSWVVKFSKEDLTGVTAWVQVGRVQYYSFKISQTYQASSDLGFFSNQYKILLPRDVDIASLKQRVHFTKLEPKPVSVTLDDQQNLIANYAFPANQAGTILLEGYVVVENTKGVDFNAAGKLEDVDAEMREKYTLTAQFWEVSAPAIQAQAMEIRKDEQDIYKIINRTYAYVVDLIDYSEVKRFGLNERQGALRTLQGGAAVCMEYSDLFIALLRAQGVPARAAFGYGYDPRSTNGVDTAHQWAEVYAPNLNSWIMVDTTWGESGKRVIGSDLNHFYKYVAAESPLEPAPVSVKYFGDIGAIPNETFTISAVASLPGEGTADFYDQAALLENFKPKVESFSLDAILASATLSASQLNATIDNAISNSWGIHDPLSRQAIRFGIYSLPLLIIIALYAFANMLRKTDKQDKIKSMQVTYRGKPQ